MPAILKVTTIAALVIALGISYKNSYAQCNLVKKVTGKITRIETHDDYQYIRLPGTYFGITFKTVLVKTPASNIYSAVIKYTGSIAYGNPVSLAFHFSNEETLVCQLTLVRIQKVDNLKLGGRVYELHLAVADVAALKDKPLKEIGLNFTKATDVVTMPIYDPGFIRTQITCLQVAAQ